MSKQTGNLKKLDRIAQQLGSVKREGLTEQLVQKLAALVLRGVIKAGDSLPPERELAEMLSVSRSSLRQALKAMQVMGVLEVRQGSGNYLTQDAREILSVPPQILVPLPGMSQAELFEVRRALEAESVATAAERATLADLQKMRQEYEAMRAHTDDPVVYVRHDMAFHQAIAVASGNRFFQWFLALANKVLYGALLKRPIKRSLEDSLAEHKAILEAIEARNPLAARIEMLRHVSYRKYYMLDDRTPAYLRFLAYEPGSKGARGESGDKPPAVIDPFPELPRG